MLCQLSSVKARLSLLDSQYDTLLTNAIAAVSARFDKECNRSFARTVDATQEFDADQAQIRVACYPVETVSRFELKTTEAEGWVEVPDVSHLLRNRCVILLPNPLLYRLSTLHYQPAVARVTYTGGYLLPGAPDPSPPVPPATPLPADLEQAAIEQVAEWYLHRDKLGLVRTWPQAGIYEQYAQLDLLLPVRAVLQRYERWLI